MKTIVVTGTTSGIGYETARGIVQRDDQLVVINRSRSKWERCCSLLKEEFPDAKISSFFADLGSMHQIRRVCSEITEKHPIIDILINNAGVYLAQKEITEDGWEKTFAVNHMAYVAICEFLIESIKKSKEGRIIQVASRAHYYAHLDVSTMHNPVSYQGQRVYGTSKLCNILHTRALAKRHPSITVNCLHPGVVQTGFARDQGGLMGWGFRLLRRFFISAKKGAQTSIFLAYDPSVQEKTGGYYVACTLKYPSKKGQDLVLEESVWNRSMTLFEQVWNQS
ncbi:MAG: hypothetical protein CL916_01890 [Deltaproteobacteria bacterium]|nr:hypothetical protein [Deltaproteobacteria bacterium]